MTAPDVMPWVEPYSMTVQRASEFTGISEDLLYRAIENGYIERRYKGERGRNFVVLTSSVKAYVDSLPAEADR